VNFLLKQPTCNVISLTDVATGQGGHRGVALDFGVWKIFSPELCRFSF